MIGRSSSPESRRRARRSFGPLVTVSVLVMVVVDLAGGAASRGTDDEVQRDFFERRVRPIFAENCTSCHGAERQRGGLRLDHGAALRQGGEGGPVVVAHDPEASRMVHAVRYADVDLRMPPRGRLKDAEIAALEEWVRNGAWWPPEEEEAASDGEEEVFDLEARRREHWAWSPLKERASPEVSDPSWSADEVDRFLLARLESLALKPAPDCDDRAWLRRVGFDLIGLPPTREEIAAFLNDTSPTRHETVVDRLLGSPRFGERWGRHWLDLIRYAESYGHEFDYVIPEAYRYRDYVIRGLNADVPFDQWLREHVAGDLLEEPRRHPTAAYDESILGTGFWHFHQATHAPVDVRQDEAERVDNQIDVLSKTFLAMTVSCARCHDHKFDAISTRDFYALAGFLQSSRRGYAFIDPGREIEQKVTQLQAVVEEGTAQLRGALAGIGDEGDALAGYLLAAHELNAVAPAVAAAQLEAEDLPVLERTGGDYQPQDLKSYGAGWTGDAHMFWSGPAPGQVLALGLRAPASGRYALSLHLTRARDYGRFKVSLDGAVVLEELDLYATEVEPSGEVELGDFELAAGEHRLQFEVTGHHPDAVPSHMFGLDFVAMSPTDADAAGKHDAARNAIAQREGLDAERLGRWIAALGAPECGEAGHPLLPWTRLSGHAERAAFEEDAGPLRTEARRQDTREGDVLFEDFSDGYEGWYTSGEAFGDGPTGPGQWDARRAAEPGREAALLTSGVAHSGALSARLQGELRSKTFTIEKSHLHYRLRGTGCKVRVIIEGYFMDTANGLLFSGAAFDVNSPDKYHWRDQSGDVSRYVGHRAHLEFLDHGDGWIEVDEIRFSDHGPQRPRDRLLDSHLVDAALRRLADGAPDARRALAAAYGDVLAGLAGAVQGDAHGAQGRELLEWLLGHGLLQVDPQRAAALVDVARRHGELASGVSASERSLALLDGSGEDEYVFIRGSHKMRGATVPRRFLEALAGGDQAPITSGSGRIELAERMLADDNPLVARVQVNRVWHHLFGRGLVPSVDNFGVLGASPSHPELLDWLASWYRDDAGWSTKALIRRLVLSRAYRMSSRAADPVAEEVDPENVALHRMNVKRLEGEVVRDSILAVSGRLEEKMYGPSVPVHLTPFMQGRGKPRGGPLDGEGRRSIYVAVPRNFISPMFLAFDAPLPHSTVGRRSVSNVPAQALIMMNDPFVHQQARRWAEQALGAEDEVDDERVAALYETAYARRAEPVEVERALAFVKQQSTARGDGDEARIQAWADLCHVLFNVKEFVFIP